MLGAIQICGKHLTHLEIKDICESLQKDSVKHISLRECDTSDDCFKHLTASLGGNRSLLQLSLSLGLVDKYERVVQLTRAMYRNRPLKRLFLHGSSLEASGAEMLLTAIKSHPNLIELDLGDCGLTDDSVEQLTSLLWNNGAKRGLEKLSLSSNSDVTITGWTKFFMALACADNLQVLSLDYNQIADEGLRVLSIVLIQCQPLKIIDLEGTGLTEESGQILLYLLRNHTINIEEITLLENELENDTITAITKLLEENMQLQKQVEQDHGIDEATFSKLDFDNFSTDEADLDQTTITTSGCESMTSTNDLKKSKKAVKKRKKSKILKQVEVKPSGIGSSIEDDNDSALEDSNVLSTLTLQQTTS